MFRYSLLEVPLPFLRIIRRLYYTCEPTWLPYRKPFALLLEAPLDWDGQLFKRLARHGARVVIADLPSSDGENVAKELGENCCFAPADVSSFKPA